MTITTEAGRSGLGPAVHARLDTNIIDSATPTATGEPMTTPTTPSRLDRLAGHARLGLRIAHLGARLDAIEDDPDLCDYRDPALVGLERQLDKAVDAHDEAAVEGVCGALLDELRPV